MQAYDLIAVPSTWLETGPLVVYEAFAASVPILGSDLGGIAELVEDGQTGRLLPVSKVKAWLDTLTEFVSHPNIIDEWRTHMPKVRTMADAADEMARLYKETQVEHER
jgi:glycosyltransferase involved in cell wall biosynthesis